MQPHLRAAPHIRRGSAAYICTKEAPWATCLQQVSAGPMHLQVEKRRATKHTLVNMFTRHTTHTSTTATSTPTRSPAAPPTRMHTTVHGLHAHSHRQDRGTRAEAQTQLHPHHHSSTRQPSRPRDTTSSSLPSHQHARPSLHTTAPQYYTCTSRCTHGSDPQAGAGVTSVASYENIGAKKMGILLFVILLLLPGGWVDVDALVRLHKPAVSGVFCRKPRLAR